VNDFQQHYPNPGADPGFRWDLSGRARFLHKGFTVDVLVRQATEEDIAHYGSELSSNDVVIVGTVELDHVELSSVEHGADITEPYLMREALAYVLDNAVIDARRQVADLVKRLAEVDSRVLLDSVDEGDTYEVDYYPEGVQPTEGQHLTGRELRRLVTKFRSERWAVTSTPEGFKAQREATRYKGAQVYELTRIDPGKESSK
jgi:hypothetical protein